MVCHSREAGSLFYNGRSLRAKEQETLAADMAG
jgi:hypothetical protein